MLYYTVVEFSIDSFEFWSGAVDVIDRVEELGKLDELEALIVDVFSDSENVTETDINDFVWFEDDMINEYLGIDED